MMLILSTILKLKCQMPTLQIINRRKNGVLALELIQLVRLCAVILIVSLSVSISIQLQSFYAFTPFKISLKRVDDDICMDLQIFLLVVLMVVNGESPLVMEFMVEIMKIISRGRDRSQALLSSQSDKCCILHNTGYSSIYVRGIVQYSL